MCFDVKRYHKARKSVRIVSTRIYSISLLLVAVALLAACQVQSLPTQSEPAVETLVPGDSLAGMKLTTGSTEAVPIWAFCSPAFGSSECSIPALPKLAIGTGWWAVDEETRDANWASVSYSYSLEGKVVDLVAFGNATSDLPLTGLDESDPDKEVIVKLSSWDIVLENLEPGQYTLHSTLTAQDPVDDGFNVLEPGVYEQIVTFTIEEPTAELDSSAAALEVERAELDAETIVQIEALVEALQQDQSLPGAAVGIVTANEVLYVKGFGVMDVETQEPVTTDSVFRLNSISKQITAAAIMQLVEEGQVRLDDLVVDYLPYFQPVDERYGQVTVQHLLNHTSGIAMPSSQPPTEPRLNDWQNQTIETDEDALKRAVLDVAGHELGREPNESFGYQNANYNLLGQIVAEVSGQAFEAYVQKHLFAPIGLENTSLLLADFEPDQLVSPHILSESGQAQVSPIYPWSRSSSPSSGLLSNVNDLTRWTMLNLNRGELEGVRVLDSSSYDALWQRDIETNWPVNGSFGIYYGKGWFLGDLDGIPTVAHGGVDLGFTSYELLIPDKSLGIVTMVNRLDKYVEPFNALELAREIALLLLDEE